MVASTANCSLAELQLEIENVSHELAARLVFRAAQDLLYLKSQVPLPVAQLVKIAGSSKIPPKVEKKRVALLEALDLFSSHLATTFPLLTQSLHISSCSGSCSGHESVPVYIAFLFGGSISMPKARFICEFERVDVTSPFSQGEDEDSEIGTESDSSDSEDFESSEQPSSSHPPPSSSSRSPSPRTLSGSSARPAHTDIKESGQLCASASLASAQGDDHEKSLRRYEQLLSRTLSCSDELSNIADEIPATQMHILIRAPREFSHPSWQPLLTQSPALDKQLFSFLSTTPSEASQRRKVLKKTPTEGLRVTCPGSLDAINGGDRPCTGSVRASTGNREEEERQEDDLPERLLGNLKIDDELIWWTWNEKLVGFSGW